MIEFTVRPDGEEPYQVSAGTRDLLVWEKTSKGKSFNGLMQDLHLVDLYKVAHIASRRQGLFHGTLEEFEESVELEFEEPAEPDPTLPVPSAGRVSPSPSQPASPPVRGPRRASGRS